MAVFPSNTTMIFRQPIRDFTIAENGTPQAKTKAFLLIASTREDSSQSRKLDIDSDVFTLPLTGRANFPSVVPNNIKAGSTADCIVWRLTDGFVLPNSFESIAAYEQFVIENPGHVMQRGIFSLKADMASRFRIQVPLGDKLRGILSAEVAWADAS